MTDGAGPLPDEYLQTLALRALSSAFARLEKERHDEEAAYAPVGEALFWASVCDEGYGALLSEWKYKAKRNADSDGELLNGMRWARNRMTHQRALVVEKHYGAEVGFLVVGRGMLGTVDHMKWANSITIPPGTHDQGRNIYEARMAGRPVIPTLEAARRWLYGKPLTQLAAEWPRMDLPSK
jgi:hypothetical protein